MKKYLTTESNLIRSSSLLSTEDFHPQRLVRKRNDKFRVLFGRDVLLSLLGVMAILFAGYQLPNLLMDDGLIPWVNQILPIVLIVSLLWSGLIILRQNPIMIWSPLPWFLGAAAIYFGFGPLVYYFGTQESIWYIDHYYFISEESLLRTNVLNVVGIGLVILGFLIGSMFSKPRTSSIGLFDARGSQRIAVVLLLIGLPVKYGLYLPHVFGTADFVLPGSIMQLRHFTALAIVPIMFLVKYGYKKWRFVLYGLVASELTVAALEFAKISFIIILLIILASWFLVVRRIRILAISFVLLTFTYYLISPLIPFGRMEIFRSSGTTYRAGLRDRLSITLRFLSDFGLSLPDEGLGYQQWWIRLNYANAQALAMNQYDLGKPGNSFELAIYTIIPRVIWPSKPLISDVGTEFNYLATGSTDTSSSPGLYAEAYWNGGWLLVAGTCLGVGVLFLVFTYYSYKNITNSKYAYLPIILMGITMGLRPDGWFVLDYVGTLVIAFFTHFLMKLIFYKACSLKKRQLKI